MFRFFMELHFPRILLAFLAVALVVTHAALPPENYWKSVLPNTQMPKAVRDLLRPDLLEDKSTSVAVGKGGVNVDAGKGKPSGTSVNVGNGGVHVDAGKGKPGGGTHVNVGGKGVGVRSGNIHKNGTDVGVGKGGVSVSTGHRGKKPVYVGVKPGSNPFDYEYAATETQLQTDPNVALFFLEKDLHPGKTMDLHFPASPNTETFLPRQVADSIPFSSENLPEIYNQFSVKPESVEAEIIKDTIKECQASGIKGEERYCATSLESMIDFSTSRLGKNVKAVSTEVRKETQMQKFAFGKGLKKIGFYKSVVCHKLSYPYAIFYCHATKTTEAYVVPMVGADGTKVKAVAVCHKDTSEWNPRHLAFQVLKVKPGTVPVCHFLPQDHIVWVSN